jgi:hypothetical protein
MYSGAGGVGFFGPVSLGFCGGAADCCGAAGRPDFAVFRSSAICKAFATSVGSSYTCSYQFLPRVYCWHKPRSPSQSSASAAQATRAATLPV